MFPPTMLAQLARRAVWHWPRVSFPSTRGPNERATLEREAFLQHVRELVRQETKRRLEIAPEQHPHSPHALNPVSPAAKWLHLTHLKVASEVAGTMHPLTASSTGRPAASSALPRVRRPNREAFTRPVLARVM